MAAPTSPSEFWNSRFSKDGFAYGDRASRLLLTFQDLFRPGQHALVPGAGEGRDAVFLAKLGLDVTAVDMSSAGIGKTETLARREGVKLNTVVADLATWEWPEATFDHVAAMFLHVTPTQRRSLHTNMLRTLKLGGHIFLEGFQPEQIAYQKRYNSGGPESVEKLFASTDIAAEFSAAETVSLMTGIETLTEGSYHTGPAALLRAVFRKTE